jgi:ribosomal protein S18 acetylase RimI-like enzyme
MVYEIDIPGCILRKLQETEIKELQFLFERCSDYFWIVDGHEVSPSAAEETFFAGPPDKSPEDKYRFGLFDPQGKLLSYLEGFKLYPDDATWWIGLLVIDPTIRGKGIGRKLVDGLARYVEQQGGKAMMLGVVQDNQPAYEFWQRMGFRNHAKSEPRQFGQKWQVVQVMRREV